MKVLRSRREKIDGALEILRQLGFPRQQQNDRSALVLLALLNLKPKDSWENADNPPIGITPIMNFFSAEYGKRYGP